MGLFGMFKQNTSSDRGIRSEVEASLKGLAPQIFPQGYGQVLAEGRSLRDMLGRVVSEEEATSIHSRSKALVFLASNKTASRCCNSIFRKCNGRLTLEQCQIVFDYSLSMLGYNSVSIVNFCTQVARNFDIHIGIGRSSEDAGFDAMWKFDPANRLLLLKEQHEVNYIAVFGSAVCETMCSEYPEIHDRLLDEFRKMMKTDIELEDYQSSSFNTPEDIISDAVGNRFTEPRFYELVFDMIALDYEGQGKEVIVNLKKAVVNANRSAMDICCLSNLRADSYVGDMAYFRDISAWAIASYAREVKRRGLRRR